MFVSCVEFSSRFDSSCSGYATAMCTITFSSMGLPGGWAVTALLAGTVLAGTVLTGAVLTGTVLTLGLFYFFMVPFMYPKYWHTWILSSSSIFDLARLRARAILRSLFVTNTFVSTHTSIFLLIFLYFIFFSY